jgi:hypothetical protein
MLKFFKIENLFLMFCFFWTFVVILMVGMNCASSSQVMKDWQEPAGGTVLIVGNILVENINQGYGFENWGLPIEIVIIGKDEEGMIHKYQTTSDDKGYFYIPNVPLGQYHLKEILLPISGSRPIRIVNDWDSPTSKFYQMSHPERSIEYTTNWFPPRSNDKIVNFNIMWFGLRAAQISNISEKTVGETLFTQKKEALNSYRFFPDGTPYSRIEPLKFFQTKIPNSGWWK